MSLFHGLVRLKKDGVDLAKPLGPDVIPEGRVAGRRLAAFWARRQAPVGRSPLTCPCGELPVAQLACGRCDQEKKGNCRDVFWFCGCARR